MMTAALRSMDRATSRLVGAPRPRWDAHDPFSCLSPWELTTSEALRVPHRFDLDRGRQLLEFAGLCTLPNAIDSALTLHCHDAALELNQQVRALLVQRGIDPDGHAEFSFYGCHQRDPGRIDLRNHAAFDEAPFDNPSLNMDAAWMPLVNLTLGGDARLLYKGLVMAEPGAGNQNYHRDAPLVTRNEWKLHEPDLPDKQVLLPAHCVVVFVPLVDIDTTNAPTDFLPGSQYADSYMDSLLIGSPEPGDASSGARLPATLCVAAGDAIVFDARVQHAGAAHQGTCRRPLLYFLYSRPWFTVDMQRRLLEEAGVAEPGKIPEQIFPLRSGSS